MRPVRKIGKYELLGRIAQGGMGSLYKARHPTLNRTVLLKRLQLHGGGSGVERFRREARLMMDLKSERIVQVYDHFKEGPHYVIVEEYVDGVSLDALIRKERYLSNDAATLILYEACRALKHAHDRNVVHRDIKPGNILISRQGQVKLADFGIATSMADTGDSLTRDGTILGTPAYLAPEQIDDPSSVDHRADIYSMGVVLYEMVTGRTPFPGTLTADTISLIHRGRYAPPQRLNPRCSPLLRRIIRRCMRVRPRQRYRDLGELLRVLEKRVRRREPLVIQEAVQAVMNGGEFRHVFRRRLSWTARLSMAALLACIVGAAGYWAYAQGYWFEYFAADRYGAVTISADLGAPASEPAALPSDPVIYRDDSGLTRVTGIDFGLHEVRLPGSDQRTIESRRLYLPPGRYRLKMGLEGGLFWSSFTVSPRTVQRRVLATIDGLRITAPSTAGIRLALHVRFTARDARTGTDLTSSAYLLVARGGRWVSPADLPADLATGTSWRFRIEAPGYYPVDYVLMIRTPQAVLDLDAQLEPRSASEPRQTAP